MKKTYIVPRTSNIFCGQMLMGDMVSYMDGNVFNGNGGNVGYIGYGGESDASDTPDSKGNSFWDV